MSHDSHTTSTTNQDILPGESIYDAQDRYLRLSKDWQDPFPAPVIEVHHGIRVVREDLLDVGSKARFGDLLVSQVPKRRPIVYVAPRFGFAGISLAYLAKRHSRRLVLFMPACKRISDHQMVAIENGAEPHFHRIAAMPNLNKIAREWAVANNGYFVPLGLKHELVTAAIVKVALGLGQPQRFWTAVSTGVLSRGLQIAWPDAGAVGVAVARNIQAGERGRAELMSHPRAFEQDALDHNPRGFESCSNYDLKVWDYLSDMTCGDLFWNVAGNVRPKDPDLWKQVDSSRSW